MTAKNSNNTENFATSKKNLLSKVNIESDDFSMYTFRYKKAKNEYFFIERNNKIALL